MTVESNRLAIASLLVSDMQKVEAEWIDLYGHMNMADYVRVFDLVGNGLLEDIGLGADYTRREQFGFFTIEVDILYIEEMRAGDSFYIQLRLLESDQKRLLSFLEMYDGANRIVATMEQLAIHVDLRSRSVTPFSNHIADHIRNQIAAHGVIPLPQGYTRRLVCSRPR
jgi:acyl-CoA thioester hydrolase